MRVSRETDDRKSDNPYTTSVLKRSCRRTVTETSDRACDRKGDKK